MAFSCQTLNCAGVCVSTREKHYHYCGKQRSFNLKFQSDRSGVFLFFVLLETRDTGAGVPLQTPETLTLYELFITELCCVQYATRCFAC